jgi:hypothetical protein
MKSLFCLVALALFAGCSKPSQPSQTDQFFVTWLTNHGETNVVVDSSGVGIAGNKTRLHASLYGMEAGKGGYSAEVEFRIRLPERGPIIEYVAGLGETTNKAIDQAMANFVLTTSHVIYKAFMNPSDPHQPVTSVAINGKTREMFAGDMIQIGVKTADPVDLQSMSEKTKALVTSAPVGSGPHWIKLIYSQNHNKPLTVAASLDNLDNAEMTAALTKLGWPSREDFYMVKQFIVVK